MMYRRALLPLVLAVGLAAAAPAQVISPTEELDFDRPEAWAMKYFASVSLLTGLGAPRARETGELELALEAGLIPHLDAAERTVGFNGTKEEDLNKLPAILRPRLSVGLPAKWSLTASWVPPLEVEGVKPNLLALAVERPLLRRGRWGLGGRLYGQVGEIEGDFTCAEEVVRFAPGSEENPFGCEAVSSDRFDLGYGGLELTGSYHLAGSGAPTVHLAAAASYMDLELQVDALTFGLRDRTLLLADGWTWSLATGASWPVGDRSRFGLEAFYTPLSVDRPALDDPLSVSAETDALLNLRLVFGYRLR